jgi:hypothetical protein
MNDLRRPAAAAPAAVSKGNTGVRKTKRHDEPGSP